MKKRFLIGFTCALASTLSMGLLAACGGEEGQKPPEKLEMNPSLVLEGKDITFSETLNATLNDLNASLEITVTKPDETQTKVNAGDSFAFDSIGYYTVTFVATRGEGEAQERVEKKVTGYIGAEGERISFERCKRRQLSCCGVRQSDFCRHVQSKQSLYSRFGGLRCATLRARGRGLDVDR